MLEGHRSMDHLDKVAGLQGKGAGLQGMDASRQGTVEDPQCIVGGHLNSHKEHGLGEMIPELVVDLAVGNYQTKLKKGNKRAFEVEQEEHIQSEPSARRIVFESPPVKGEDKGRRVLFREIRSLGIVVGGELQPSDVLMFPASCITLYIGFGIAEPSRLR